MKPCVTNWYKLRFTKLVGNISIYCCCTKCTKSWHLECTVWKKTSQCNYNMQNIGAIYSEWEFRKLSFCISDKQWNMISAKVKLLIMCLLNQDGRKQLIITKYRQYKILNTWVRNVPPLSWYTLLQETYS